mgnify:FL=1
MTFGPLTYPVSVSVSDVNALTPGGYAGRSNASVLTNALTQIGYEGDSSNFNRFRPPRRLGDHELYALGRDELIARSLGARSAHGTRAGWRLLIHDDIPAEDKAAIESAVKRKLASLGARPMIRAADTMAQQYGLAVLLLGTNYTGPQPEEHTDWTQPLDLGSELLWLSPYDRRSLHVSKLSGVESPNFRRPEVYTIDDFACALTEGERDLGVTHAGADFGRQLDVHWTRCMRFAARDGVSRLQGMQHVIAGFLDSLKSTTAALREQSVGVYTIGNYRETQWGGDGNAIQEKIRLQDRAKSAINALVLSGEETYDVPSRNLSGVDGILDRWMVVVAAYFGVPVTQMWGVSPGGFGTGEHETRNFDDEVRAWQTDQLSPELMRLVAAAMLDPTGGGLAVLPERWELVFEPLRQPSAKELAETRRQAAEYFALLIQSGIVHPDMVARSALAGEFTLEMQLDEEDLERLSPDPQQNEELPSDNDAP